jgi:malic enzyme
VIATIRQPPPNIRRAPTVAVISNGSAVLGSISALASKPVMEGKAVLFKKSAGIDVSRDRCA